MDKRQAYVFQEIAVIGMPRCGLVQAVLKIDNVGGFCAKPPPSVVFELLFSCLRLNALCGEKRVYLELYNNVPTHNNNSLGRLPQLAEKH